MHDMVRGYWRHFNLSLEGEVEHMYLDWKGWLSTGVGNKIDETRAAMSPPTPAERTASLVLANQINWMDPAGGAASPGLVADDWDTVKARLDLAPMGHRAFEGIARLRITDEEIGRIVFAKVDEMEGYLSARPEFANFANWPASAQLATLSMCWGLGPAFRFPKFQAFVAVEDWAGAAEECHFSPDVGSIRIRNGLDRFHFLNAAAAVAQGLPVESLAITLGTVLCVQHALYMIGWNPGPQDDGDGAKTSAAVTDFQAASGIPQNGRWDDPVTRDTLADALRSCGWSVF